MSLFFACCSPSSCLRRQVAIEQLTIVEQKGKQELTQFAAIYSKNAKKPEAKKIQFLKFEFAINALHDVGKVPYATIADAAIRSIVAEQHNTIINMFLPVFQGMRVVLGKSPEKPAPTIAGRFKLTDDEVKDDSELDRSIHRKAGESSATASATSDNESEQEVKLEDIAAPTAPKPLTDEDKKMMQDMQQKDKKKTAPNKPASEQDKKTAPNKPEQDKKTAVKPASEQDKKTAVKPASEQDKKTAVKPASKQDKKAKSESDGDELSDESDSN